MSALQIILPIERSLKLRADKLLNIHFLQFLLKLDGLRLSLYKIKMGTKSNLSYSSIHLLLPTPNVFQQFSRLVKYSGGIRGFFGTTFFDMERISLRSIRNFGGGPICCTTLYLIDIIHGPQLNITLLPSPPQHPMSSPTRKYHSQIPKNAIIKFSLPSFPRPTIIRQIKNI